MSPRCSVCSHPDIADLNAQLVEGGASLRGIARKYLLSEDALSRHRKNHLPKVAVREATEAREFDHFRRLKILEKVLYSVLTSRLKDQDHGMVLRVHASLLRNMEFEVKLGEVEDLRRELEDLRQEIERREIDR